jgi:hypothetical protein
MRFPSAKLLRTFSLTLTIGWLFGTETLYGQTQPVNIYCVSNGDLTGDCYSFSDGARVDCQYVPGGVFACRAGGVMQNCTSYAPMQFSCKPVDLRTLKTDRFPQITPDKPSSAGLETGEAIKGLVTLPVFGPVKANPIVNDTIFGNALDSPF